MRGIAAALLLVVALVLATQSVVKVRFGMGDFKAFYCSARVLEAHEDPYAAAPLARCEREREPWPLFEVKRNEVLPAPLPAYAIVGFMPFTLLPFPSACIAWLLLSIAATIGAAVLLARCGVASVLAVVMALSFLVVQDSLPLGELPPIALFGLALAVWGARWRRWWAITLGVALTFSEPQIGAAVAIVAFALGRRYAVPAIVTTAVLALVSLLALGISGNVEYIQTVLPAHVASELPSVLQFGFPSILYQLGVHSDVALLAGRAFLFSTLVLAFGFACTPFARERPHVALMAAPVFAAVGAPFLHFDHIALVAPATLWLASHARIPVSCRLAVLLCLVLPPLYLFAHFDVLVLVPFTVLVLVQELYGDLSLAIRASAVVMACVIVLATLALLGGVNSHAVAPASAISSTLAQQGWSQYIASHLAMSGWVVWLVKAPTWLAIVATATALALVGRVRRRELAVA